MSPARRRFIIAYIFLVGVPLLALAGVLKAGRSLTAPVSANGVWKVEVNADRLIPGSCGDGVAASATSLTILQSGNSLSVSLEGPAVANGSGRLNGTTLRAPLTLIRTSSGAGCCSGQRVIFTATVDPQSEPRVITGILTAEACPSCSPISFRAIRQPRPTIGAGGH